MTDFFDFSYVTDPPDDELVDPVTQLNNNWQIVNDKLNGFQTTPNTIPGTIPVGTEAFYPGSPSTDSNRLSVYNGTNWYRNFNRGAGITVWTPIELLSPIVARSGYDPVGRVNTVQRYVEFAGAVQNTASASAWNPATEYELTTTTAIDDSILPVGGLSYHQVATGQDQSAGGFSSAIIYAVAVTTSTPHHVSLRMRFQGNAGGGNFVCLDGIKWWY